MTTGEFPDRVVLAVKDGIRSVRYSVRRSLSEGRGLAAARDPLGLLEPVASAAERVIGGVEAATSALLADPRQTAMRLAFPLRVETYFRRSRADTENAYFFTEVVYGALKGLLQSFGAKAYVVSELAIEEAWATLRARSTDLVSAVVDPVSSPANSSRQDNVRSLCAAIAIALAERQPIKKLAPGPDEARNPKHLLDAPDSYCCWVIGLSTAIVSLAAEGDPLDKRQITAAADAAVDARFSRFMSAARSRDPIGALSSEFAAVLPFLP